MKIYIENEKKASARGYEDERKGKNLLTVVAKNFVNSYGFTQGVNWNKRQRLWGDRTDYSKGVKQNCPLNVPIALVRAETPIQVQRRKAVPASERLPELQQLAMQGSLPAEVMVDWARQYLQSAPLIMSQTGKTQAYIRKIDKRGMGEYQKKTGARISAAIEKLQKRYKYCYFYTSTYAVNTHGKDLLNAFKVVKEQSRRIQRNIRRLLKGDYVNVFEFTKKGYAHAHTLLGTNSPVAAPENNEFIKRRLRKGRLYSILTKGLLSPVLEIRSLEKGRLSSYLQKYLSKGLSLPDVPISEQVLHCSKECIKQIYGILIPYLTGLRQFSISQGLRTGAGEALYVNHESITKQLERMDWLLKHNVQQDMFYIDEFRGIAYNLINILIKLTNHCRNHTFILSRHNELANKDEVKGSVDFAKQGEMTGILEGAKKLNCPGCPVSTLLDRILDRGETLQRAILAFYRQGQKGYTDVQEVYNRFFLNC